MYFAFVFIQSTARQRHAHRWLAVQPFNICYVNRILKVQSQPAAKNCVISEKQYRHWSNKKKKKLQRVLVARKKNGLGDLTLSPFSGTILISKRFCSVTIAVRDLLLSQHKLFKLYVTSQPYSAAEFHQQLTEESVIEATRKCHAPLRVCKHLLRSFMKSGPCFKIKNFKT